MRFTIRRTMLAGALALMANQGAQAQDGTFDPTWPTEGRGLIRSGAGFSDLGNSIAVQSTGRLVLGGNCSRIDAPPGVCVMGLLPDGAVDTEHFGNILAGYGTMVLANDARFTGNHQIAQNGLALQHDNRIVVGSTEFSNGRNEARVTRLSASGTFIQHLSDPIYRRVLFADNDPSTADDAVNAVAVAPDGKIVAAGATAYHYDDGSGGEVVDWDMGVARFNADMTPDVGFNGDGTRTVALDQGGDDFDRASAVAVQSDGKIVVAGVARSADGTVNMDAVVVRLNVDGSLDDSFNMGGKATIPPIPMPNGSWVVNSVNAVAIDRRGRILIAGSMLRFDLSGAQGVVIQQFVARLTSQGARDTSFVGIEGVNVITWPFTNPERDEVFGLALQGDGKILLYGSAATDQQAVPASAWVAERLLPNGAIDASFGNSGAYGGYSPPQGPFPATNDARGAVIANGGLFLTGRAFDYGGAGYFGVAKLRIDAIFSDGFDP